MELYATGPRTSFSTPQYRSCGKKRLSKRMTYKKTGEKKQITGTIVFLAERANGTHLIGRHTLLRRLERFFPPHWSNTVSLSDSLSFTGDRGRRAKTGASCTKKKANETRSHLRIDTECPKCKIKTLHTVRPRRERAQRRGSGDN